MKSISSHCRGLLVERWQYFLLGRGYIKEVTGIFDEVTLQGTKLFQWDNSITEDGIVGNETFQKAMELGFLLIELGKHGTNDYHFPYTPRFRAATPYLVKNCFGNIPLIEQHDGKLEVNDNWILKNMVILKSSDLNLAEKASQNLIINKKIEHKILSLFSTWNKQGLLHLIRTINTTFEVRYLRGHHGILSSHAYGIAFDINEQWNRIGHIPKYKNEIGSVRELVPIANELGFYWGGHMKRSEGAHFEFARLNLLKK